VRLVLRVAALALVSGCAGSVDLGGSTVEAGADAGPAVEATTQSPGDSASGAEGGSARDGAGAPAVEAGTDVSSTEASVDSASEAQSDAPVDGTPEALPPEGGGASCTDHVKDGAETDVDCGGPECPGCGPRKACLADTDCSATLTGCDADSGGCACDALSMTCVYDHCFDERKDGDETDVDCGGSLCTACAQGQGCRLDADCTTLACDAVSALCVPNQCTDHRQDGSETDVDCGGANVCTRCAPGKKCVTSSDCRVGIMCGTTTPGLCG
jgi:hypothetical protein